MAFSRVKPAGWAFGEKLTSAQMNALDTQLSLAVDCNSLALGGTFGPFTRRAQFMPTLDAAANWNATTALVNDGYIEAAINTAPSCWWPLRLPHGATLTTLAVSIDPAGGHGALPAEMPKFIVRSVTNTGTAANEVATTTDSSANTGAYEPAHDITASGLSVAISNTTKRYTVIFTAEGGANALAGTKVFLYSYTWTMTNLDFD